MNVEGSATSGQHDRAFNSMDIHPNNDSHGDVQVHPHQPFLTYSTQLPDPYGLRNFYQSSGPWNPLAGAGLGQQNDFVAPLTENYPPPGALLYRSKEQASECGTSQIDDSGYASRLIPSVGQPSRVANDFPDGERLVDIHLDSGSQVVQTGLNLTVPKVSSRPRPINANIPCPRSGCRATIKTKSEMNKHLHRHDQPFRCELPNCPRDRGFSTKNDLQRHQRTVHQKMGGDAQTYYCIIGECGKKSSAPKAWPRADNFRQHLHRVHNIDKKADDDLTPFLGVPNRQPLNETAQEQHSNPDPNALNFTGIGSFESFHNLKRPKRLHDSEMVETQQDEPLHGTHQPDIEAAQWQIQDRELLNTGADGSEDVDGEIISNTDEQGMRALWTIQPPTRQGTLRRSSRILQATSDLLLEDISTMDEVEAPTSPSSICLDVSTSAVRPEIQEIVNALPDLLGPRREGPSDAQSIAEVLRKLVPSETLSTVAQILLDGALPGTRSDMGDSKYLFSCGECNKKFPRQCELKKHKKRHEKPYGCTFKGCNKDFGSKNDWKRHESSQHLQLETWSCDYEGCSKICNRRESFKNHLIREHGKAPDAQLEQQLEKRRLGRHCDRQYWCGFCKKIQNITSSNVNCWTVRCDHIDDHICGRNSLPKVPMASWVYLEDQSRPGTPTRGGRPVTVPHSARSNSDLDKGSKGLKRKSDGLEMQRTKKQFQPQAQDGWLCCSCTDSCNSTHVNVSCTSCDHYRCSNCQALSFNRGRKQTQDGSA